MSGRIVEIAERHAHGRVTGSDVGVLFAHIELLTEQLAAMTGRAEAAELALSRAERYALEMLVGSGASSCSICGCEGVQGVVKHHANCPYAALASEVPA